MTPGMATVLATFKSAIEGARLKWKPPSTTAVAGFTWIEPGRTLALIVHEDSIQLQGYERGRDQALEFPDERAAWRWLEGKS